MKARILGIIVALVFHAAVILFGGLLFWGHAPTPHYQQVELLAEDTGPAADAKDRQPDRDKEKNNADEPAPDETVAAEDVPDTAAVIREIEASAAAAAPALEAASLGAIEAALSGSSLAGGDFGSLLTFASGGRIGGLGKPGAVLSENLEQAFSLAEIDQKPRVLFQVSPTYPHELRTRKLDGVVQVVFVVDTHGRVAQARVERSCHAAFDRPALDAVRRWKFEPAVKGGQKVNCKLRVPIRFQPA